MPAHARNSSVPLSPNEALILFAVTRLIDHDETVTPDAIWAAIHDNVALPIGFAKTTVSLIIAALIRRAF